MRDMKIVSDVIGEGSTSEPKMSCRIHNDDYRQSMKAKGLTLNASSFPC